MSLSGLVEQHDSTSEKLQTRRKSHGLKALRGNQTLAQVAEATGVSRAYIQRLEAGKVQTPSIEILTKIANHYGCPVSRLISEFYPGVSEQISNTHSSPTQRTLVGIPITESEQNKLEEYLAFIRAR